MAPGDLSIEQVMGKLKIDPCVNLKRADKKQHGNGSSSDANGSVGESELDFEPLAVPHLPTNYCEYYYPGYQGFSGGSDSQGFYLNGDGLEMQYPVMVVDNGSPVSFMPGFQLSYNPYTCYLPMATIDADGQYVIAQQPSSLSPVFSPSYASSFYYPTCYGKNHLNKCGM